MLGPLSEHPACLVRASPAFTLGSGDTSSKKPSPALGQVDIPSGPPQPPGPLTTALSTCWTPCMLGAASGVQAPEGRGSDHAWLHVASGLI